MRGRARLHTPSVGGQDCAEMRIRSRPGRNTACKRNGVGRAKWEGSNFDLLLLVLGGAGLQLSILHHAQEIAQEDDDGDFADGRDVDGGLFLDFGREVLHAGQHSDNARSVLKSGTMTG
jgi:hypothetical protein